MNDEGWEARMAERTRLRREAEAAEAQRLLEQEWRAEIDEIKASMTPSKAAAVLAESSRAACACLGGPMCCIKVYRAATEILAAGAVSPVD